LPIIILSTMAKEVILKDHLSTRKVGADLVDLVDLILSQAIPIRKEFPHRRGDAGTKNK